jgi:hypothetical protein
MQISGFPSPISDPRATRVDDRNAPAAAEGGAARPADRGVAAPATTRAEATVGNRAPQRPGAAVPAEAPAGTDPALWSVLTTEERAFFARAAATGPLTYTKMMGQMKAPAAGMPRGGRMDVRV